MFTRTLSVCLLVAAVSCGKAPPTSPTPAAVEPTTDSAVAARPAASAVAPDATQIAAALAEATQAVRKYAFEKRRVPKTLDELVAAGYLSQLPQAPPGKRFEISKKLEVYLAD